MEAAGHKSVVGASGGGDGGHLCHLCGYKFASAHPSAKQRRAHRKNCGGGGGGTKSPPAATVAAAPADVEEERQQAKKLLLLDEREAEAGGGTGGGEGNGQAAASDTGGGSHGSAQDVGNAVEGGDNGVHPSPNDAGVQVIISDITSEESPKANGTEIQTEIATQRSENAPHVEDLHPSESHVSGDQSQDSSASHRQSEPEDGANFSPDITVDEISRSNDVSLTPNAASDEISAQTGAAIGCPDDIAATEKDCMINNIEEDKIGEDMLVKGSEIVEGHSATIMEKDLYVNNISVVSVVQIPSEETESKEESGVVRTNSVEQELGNEEPCNDKDVLTGDTRGDDSSELDSGGCHLEAADVVKTQQQTDSICVVEEQLTNSKQADLEEEQSYLDADKVIKAASSETGPAGTTSGLTEEDPSEVTKEDCIQSNSSHPSGTIAMPSLIDLVEPCSEPTSHEISMISSKEDFDENITADLISRDRIEALGVDTEETTSHETKTVCGTDDVEEIKHIEQITAQVSPPESSVLQSTCSVEEKEQIEEVIADPKVDVISGRDIVVEKEQGDVYAGTAHEVNVVNILANAELKKHNDDKTEEMSEVPSSHEQAVVGGTENVKEKDQEPMPDPTSQSVDAVSTDVVDGTKLEEEATSEHTSGINVVHTIDNAKEKESEGHASACKIDAGGNAAAILVVDPDSHGNNTPQSMDDAAEKNQNEKVVADHAGDNIPAVQSTDDASSCKIDAGGNAAAILVVDPDSHGNNTAQSMDDAAEKNQNEKVAAEHAGDNMPAVQSTDDAAEKKQMDETATTEIPNGDHHEEITDKEMTIDSDKSHVSLKSLLSEKGTDTKEKKAGTKDRVLSFRRRSSKDNPSPGKTGSVEQDWNSPARLPVEKSPKGKKQPWMPFICCHSMN